MQLQLDDMQMKKDALELANHDITKLLLNPEQALQNNLMPIKTTYNNDLLIYKNSAKGQKPNRT